MAQSIHPILAAQAAQPERIGQIRDGGRMAATALIGDATQIERLADVRIGDLTGTDAIRWSYDRDTSYVPSPVLTNDRLYILKRNSGVLTCLDAKTGQVVYGPERLPGVSNVYASPVAAAGHVYIAGRKGTTVVLKDTAGFEVVAKNTLDEGFDASPAIAGDALFLRGTRHLYKIAAE